MIFKKLFFLFFLFCLGCPSTSGPEPRPQPKKKKDVYKDVSYNGTFPHPKHIFKEVDGECLTCHPLGASGAIQTKLLCAECHKQERRILFEAAKRRGASLYPSFDHKSHTKTPCFQCHTKDAKGEYLRRQGFSSCFQCHGPHKYFDKRPDCLGCHSSLSIQVKKNRQKKFSHFHHSTEGNCSTCHGNIPDSTDLPSALISHSSRITRQCNTCHVSSQRVLKKGSQAVPSFLFSHKAHLKKNSSCSGCHILKGETVAFEKEMPQYEGCIRCHPTWKVKKHKDITLCLSCHNLKDSFRFPQVTRKFSTQKFLLQRDLQKFHQDHTITGSCRECHLKIVPPVSPSFVKAFDHKTHLPSTFAEARENSHCLRCHSSPEKPEAILSQACLGCHSQIPQNQSRVSQQLTVPVFDHGQHKKLKCLDCHRKDGKTPLPSLSRTCQDCHHPKKESRWNYPVHQACFRCHQGYDALAQKKTDFVHLTLSSLDHLKTPHTFGKDCRKCHVQGEETKMFDTPTKIVRRTGGFHGPPDCGKCHFKLRK